MNIHVPPPGDGRYGQDVRERAFQFACRTVRFCDQTLKHGGAARVLAPQLVRCSTSVGANLEEARAAESRRDFISKCSIALKEARETRYRLALAVETSLGSKPEAQVLLKEADELTAIIGAIVRNARRNLTRDVSGKL